MVNSIDPIGYSIYHSLREVLPTYGSMVMKVYDSKLDQIYEITAKSIDKKVEVQDEADRNRVLAITPSQKAEINRRYEELKKEGERTDYMGYDKQGKPRPTREGPVIDDLLV